MSFLNEAQLKQLVKSLYQIEIIEKPASDILLEISNNFIQEILDFSINFAQLQKTNELHESFIKLALEKKFDYINQVEKIKKEVQELQNDVNPNHQIRLKLIQQQQNFMKDS